MPFIRPTLSELVGRVRTDVSAKVLSSGAVLARSVLGILAQVFAGIVHTLYDYITYAVTQAMPDTAQDEFLDRHVAIYLPNGRLPATPSIGVIRFTGTDGAIIPKDTQINRSDGVSFTTDADATIGSLVTGYVDVAVTASVPAEDSNTEAGAVLSLTYLITNVGNDATVQSNALTGGTDRETDVSVRQRMLDAIQFTPQGGSIKDYETWAREVPDVDQVWVYANSDAYGLGTIKLMFSVVSGTEIPSGAKATEVQAHVDANRPVTATTSVEAPLPLSITLDLTITPDTAANRGATTAEVEAFIRDDRAPEKTLLLNDVKIAALGSGITTAIVNSPASDIIPATDELINEITVTYS